jgi:hypothetical protein
MNDRIAKLQLGFVRCTEATPQVRFATPRISARRSSPSLVPARPSAAPSIAWREKSACQPPR